MDDWQKEQDDARGRTYPKVRPSDAASLVLIDGSLTKPRFLMGKRSDGHVFLPGFHVFPGGRMEAADTHNARNLPMHDGDRIRVANGLPGKGGEGRARGLVHCALREAGEETGIALTGGHDRLRYLARAITPPRNVRRYDTRFFLGRLDDLSGQFDPHTQQGDGELLEAGWFAPDEIDPQFLHRVTRFVISEALERLKRDPQLTGDLPVACRKMVRGRIVTLLEQ